MNIKALIARALLPLTTLCLVLGVSVGTTTAARADDSSVAAAFSAWREGRAVILMRHAFAPGVGDPAGHDLNDCSTQRILSEAGRDQARQIGQRLQAEVEGPVAVYSSEWCRCMDTGRLLDFDEPVALPALNSFFNDFSAREPQTRELHDWVRTRLRDAQATPAVLVSHQVNISALAGQGTASGEFLVVELIDDEVRVLAAVQTPVP